MNNWAAEDQPIRQAATLVLLRDGTDGLETLLLQRNSRLDFAPGAWVFPGGRVEDADVAAASGKTEAAARYAVVRETHEEAALLIDPEPLVHFAHWTTPVGAPKRYATWFFATAWHGDADVMVDGSEIAAFDWVRPQRALEAFHQGGRPMMPPTVVTLQQLAQSRSVAQALDAFAHRKPEVFEPKIVVCDKDVCFLYGGDSGYDAADIDAPEPHHRFWMGQQSRYIRS